MSDGTPDPRGYAAKRHASLPWGYWLRQDPFSTRLFDEDGSVWHSLRQNLWERRLGMAVIESYTVDMACEVLLSILHARTTMIHGFEAVMLDLFGGSWQQTWHYKAWLKGQGLLQRSKVTVESRAIARMLGSTRPSGAPDLAPLDFPTLQSFHGLDGGTTRDQRERVMARQEALGSAMRYRFVREPMFGRPGITFIGYQLGDNIPLTRVLWTQMFPDDYARDRMFGWLADRLDRWSAWGEIAAIEGSRALSEHLLQLKFADEPIDLG